MRCFRSWLASNAKSVRELVPRMLAEASKAPSERSHVHCPHAFNASALNGELTMPKLRTLAPKVRIVDTRITRMPRRRIDPIYNTPEFQGWRAQVIARAGGQC